MLSAILPVGVLLAAFAVGIPSSPAPWAKAGDRELGATTCCSEKAACCFVSESCCPVSLVKSSTGGTEFNQDRVAQEKSAAAQPICCLKKAYCCQQRGPCCRGSALPAERRSLDGADSVKMLASAKAYCCEKRAYCCSKRMACCR